jgi:hypothetical protein
VKSLLPVILAGGTFSAATVIGLFGGIVAGARLNQPLLVPAGLMLGAAIGAFSAVRLLLRSLR